MVFKTNYMIMFLDLKNQIYVEHMLQMLKFSVDWRSFNTTSMIGDTS